MPFERRENKFTKTYRPLANRVQRVLEDYIGRYEEVEDDAWFIVGTFRHFAHWGGDNFLSPHYSPQDGPPSTRQSQKEFNNAATKFQRAYDAVKKLCQDYGACESIAWAIFENTTKDKRTNPRDHFLEAINGLDTLGKAIQKVRDDGKLFKCNWRNQNKMKRAIISNLASIFEIRYRKGSNDPLDNYNEFQKVVAQTFSAIYAKTDTEDCTDECPDNKTIKDELTIRNKRRK